MTVVTKTEAQLLFRSMVKHQRRLKQSSDYGYMFIEEAFRSLANKGIFEVGNKKINASDLGAMEVAGLCRLAEKFFKNEKNLAVSGELIRNIETVMHTNAYAYNQNIDNRGKLNSLIGLVFQNEDIETDTGVRPDLQVELREVIRQMAQELRTTRRNARIKRAAFIVGGFAGVLGSMVGAFALLLTGAVGGGLAVLVVGSLASITAALVGTGLAKRKVERAQKDLDKRISAFDMLKNEEKFHAFCRARSLDPATVALESLLK